MASKSGYINIDENEEITIEEQKTIKFSIRFRTGSMYQFYER